MTLQLGSFPIVKSSLFTEYFRDKVPIFIYNTLDDITEDNLKKFKETAKLNYDVMNIDYYKEKINNIYETVVRTDGL